MTLYQDFVCDFLPAQKYPRGHLSRDNLAGVRARTCARSTSLKEFVRENKFTSVGTLQFLVWFHAVSVRCSIWGRELLVNTSSQNFLKQRKIHPLGTSICVQTSKLKKRRRKFSHQEKLEKRHEALMQTGRSSCY